MSKEVSNPAEDAVEANGRSYELRFHTGRVASVDKREIVHTTPAESHTVGGGGYVMTNAVGQVHGSIAPTRTRYFGEETTRRRVIEGFLVDENDFEWFTEFEHEARTGQLVTEIQHNESKIGQYNHATKELALFASERFLGCVSECDEAARNDQRALNEYENAKTQQKNTELSSWWIYPVTPAAAFACFSFIFIPLQSVFEFSDELAGGALLVLTLLTTLGIWGRTYKQRRSEKKVLARKFTGEEQWSLQKAVLVARFDVTQRYKAALWQAVIERVEAHAARTDL